MEEICELPNTFSLHFLEFLKKQYVKTYVEDALKFCSVAQLLYFSAIDDMPW